MQDIWRSLAYKCYAGTFRYKIKSIGCKQACQLNRVLENSFIIYCTIFCHGISRFRSRPEAVVIFYAHFSQQQTTLYQADDKLI